MAYKNFDDYGEHYICVTVGVYDVFHSEAGGAMNFLAQETPRSSERWIESLCHFLKLHKKKLNAVSKKTDQRYK